MKRLSLLVVTVVIAPLQLAADDDIAPAWYLEEIATLTAGSGRWIADNSAFRSEQESYDAYVTEWVAGFGGTTMTGRLFAIQDGTESVDFWEFRQYWHPGLEKVVVEQFGWGSVVGVGTSWQEDGVTRTLQTFYAADGSSREEGHASYFQDDVTHVTESFDVVGDQWTPRRKYTWRRTDSQQ